MKEDIDRLVRFVETLSPFGQARALKAVKKLAAEPSDEAWINWVREMGKITDAENK